MFLQLFRVLPNFSRAVNVLLFNFRLTISIEVSYFLLHDVISLIFVFILLKCKRSTKRGFFSKQNISPFYSSYTVTTAVITMTINSVSVPSPALLRSCSDYRIFVNSQLRLLHFWLFDWPKNSDYESIVGILRHMENSAPNLKTFFPDAS